MSVASTVNPFAEILTVPWPVSAAPVESYNPAAVNLTSHFAVPVAVPLMLSID